MKVDNSLKSLIKLLSKELPDLKPREIVNVKLVKKINNREAVVSIKGKLLKAVIKSDVLLNRFKAEVLKTEPQLELKMLKEPIQKLDSFLVKKIAVSMKKAEIFKALLDFQDFDLKELSKSSLKRLIDDSGLFFEAKLVRKDENLTEDFKYNLLKKELKNIVHKDMQNGFEKISFKDEVSSDFVNSKNAITKLQINLLINGAIHIPFKSEKFDIKEGEIKIKKRDGGFYIYLKMNFTKLGEVILALKHFESKTEGIIYSEQRFEKLFDDLTIENVKLTWKPLDEDVEKYFDLDNQLTSQLGHFDLIV